MEKLKDLNVYLILSLEIYVQIWEREESVDTDMLVLFPDTKELFLRHL